MLPTIDIPEPMRPQEKLKVQRTLGLSDPRRIGKVRRVRREQQHERLLLLGGTPQELERVVSQDMDEIAFLLAPDVGAVLRQEPRSALKFFFSGGAAMRGLDATRTLARPTR
jgi:hypothetical protein